MPPISPRSKHNNNSTKIPLALLLIVTILYYSSKRTTRSVYSSTPEYDSSNTVYPSVEIESEVEESIKDLNGYRYFSESNIPTVKLHSRPRIQIQETPSTKREIINTISKNSKWYSVAKYITKYSITYGHSSDRVHPITELIEEAAVKWENLLNRQSRTLGEAVVEYKSRYGRNPPKGFDLWWKFATDNNVILVDEYDQINIDIEPFLALPSKEMLRRATDLATNQAGHHFSLIVEGGKVKTTGPREDTYRAHDANAILSQFSQHIEDMPITVSGDDGAAFVITGHARSKYLQHVRSSTELQGVSVNDTMDTDSGGNWMKTCAPDSIARKKANGQHIFGTPSSAASFVDHDHLSAMNMCNHPENLPIHGFTNSWPGPSSMPLVPIFAWSKTQMHADLLSAALDQYYTPTEETFEWEEKKNQVLWRGSSTGIWAFKDQNWRNSQRARLVTIANEQIGEMSVRFATLNGAIRRFIGKISEINAFYFDISYAGSPVQCDENQGTCAEYLKNYLFTPPMSVKEQNGYKYILDVDGNAWSGRFHRLMASKSVVFKSTIFPEWYSSRVVPWYHYVPIKNDYSDLYDVSAYFMGTPDGNNDHDAAGKLIGSQGQDWTAKHWREVDMAAYQFRLYLEYGRALYKNKGSHDFIMPSAESI